MPRKVDRDYHEARAMEEFQRAEEASDPAIAKAHRELAALHRRKMMETVDPPPAKPPLGINWNAN